jgi:F-type H+-transporting ATPase subunit a
VISNHPLAEGGGVPVGEHLQWHVFGLTINVDTVISTAIAAAIVLGFGLYLAAKATAKVPSGLQLVFETVIDSSSSQIGWRSCRTPGKNTSDHPLRM